VIDRFTDVACHVICTKLVVVGGAGMSQTPLILNPWPVFLD
jgi:hypothetical protein